MAPIKSYTDIEQSKKLAEILPLESADMFYNEEPDEVYLKDVINTKYPMVIGEEQKHHLEEYGVPCWSLAALLGVLPDDCGINKENGKYVASYILSPSNECGAYIKDNPIDACYEMILYLNEQNLL